MLSRIVAGSVRMLCLVSLCAPLGADAAEPEKPEEIIVTASKRKQNLQDVTVAVTATQADRLEQAGIGNLDDLQAIVPTISFANDFSFAKLTLRGIGLNSSFTGVDPSVAFYVDGAVVSQSTAQLSSLFDLERVEVLRGPQGTLYGRNATGGSVNAITHKPSSELEGYARVTAGTDRLQIGEAAVGGPLVGETVLGRVALRFHKRDGFGNNTVTGNDIDDANKFSGRGQLQFNLSDSLDWLVSAEYSRENDAALGVKFRRESFPGTTMASLRATGAGFATGDRDIASDTDFENDRDTSSYTSTFTWEISDAFTARSITNYRDLDVLLLQDLDVSPTPTSSLQAQALASKQSSQEFQLLFDRGRLQGLIGLYYFEERLEGDNLLGNDPLRGADPGVGVVPSAVVPGGFFLPTRVALRGKLETDAQAVFANARYELTDRIAARVGGRFSHEKRRINNDFKVRTGGGAVVATNFRDRKSFTDWSPEVGIDFRPMEDVLFYVTYSQAFKSGSAEVGAQSARIVDPEDIDNVELGIKSGFFSNRVLANVSTFYYKIDDLQLGRTMPDMSPAMFTTLFENAAETRGRGAELELRWLATDALSFDGSIAYLDSEFREFDTANPIDPAQPPQITSLAGNPTRQAPKLNWSLHGTYELAFTNGSALAFDADVSYRSEQFFTEFEDDITGENDYSLVGASITYTSPSGNYSVSLWGKNLTNQRKFSGVFPISSSRTIAGTLTPPASLGITLGYKF